jgi:PAS domain S-box-containing protein
MNDAEKTKGQLIEELEERERQLSAFHQVALTMLSSLDLDELLDNLGKELIKAGLFRSMVIALVDESDRTIEVVRSFFNRTQMEKGVTSPVELMDERETGSSPVGRRHYLDDDADKDILLEVARTGEMRIELFNSITDEPAERITEIHREKWGYFIPVKDGERVIAVLATGSWVEEKDIVLERIEAMRPLLDQVAIALRHEQVEKALEQEHRFRESDTAIRLAVASINEPQDLERVLTEISSQLTQFGVAHEDISLQIMNGEGTSFFNVGPHISETTDWSRVWDELHWVVQDGTISFRHPPDEEFPDAFLREKQTVIDVWKNGTFRYEPCTPEGVSYMLSGASIVDVAFSHGTLAINRKQLNAFNTEDIALLQRFAKIISEGFQRFLDITERKQAEEEVKIQQEQLQAIMDNTPLYIYLTDIDNRFLVLNRMYTDFFDISAEEALGNTTALFFPPETVAQFEAQNRQVIETGESMIFEETIPAPGGEMIVLTTKFPLRDPQGEIYGVCGITLDITENKQMERELIRLERLRAVGELSAGVSHNLNNILTNILGPAQILQRKTDDPELLREIDDIEISARRARDLVHELHLSVRNVKEESLHPVPVDQVVQQAVQTSRPRWKDQPEAQGLSIKMVTEWGGVPSIQGTGAGLHDILTNLIFNAVDAMPKGGTIAIETQKMGDQVQITFSDTGTGMDEETRRRVFEPFFTTKMDVGSGLGLSTAYNAITGWGGSIEVDSIPGEGTSFILRFPVWAEEIAEREEKSADAPPPRSGKILVVDDDEAICSLLARLLGKQHQVETAIDGGKALDLFAPGKYDVVLIDLGMSEMPGDQVLKQVKVIDPQVATVLITGWNLPDTDTRVASFDFQVRKPFDDLDEIEDIVARALEVHDKRTEKTS